MRRYPEDDFQEEVCTLLDSLDILWCHVANERRTSPQAGARLKRKGVKSGVPDCMIFEPFGNFNGLAIELKIGKNRLSDNQKTWSKRLKENGWYSVTCYSIEEVRKEVNDYLQGVHAT